MPDLSFTSSGVATAINAQERLKGGAVALRDLYKQQNLELAKTARETQAAIRSTLTESEKIEKKIAAIKAAQAKGIGDQGKNQEALNRLEEKLRKVKGSADGAGKSLGKAFGDSTFAHLSRWVGPAGAIAGSMKLISDEIRDQLRLIDEGANAKMDVSQARNRVIRTMDGSDSMKFGFLEQISKLAADNGADEARLLIAAETGLSRSGGNKKAVLSALESTGKYLFDQPGDWNDFVGGQLAMQKVTGSLDANVNLGLMKQTGTLSAVADQALQGKNIPTALIGLKGFGLNNAQSASLFATMTTEANDTTGEPTGTAAINLARAVRDFRADDLSKKQFAMLGDEGIAALRKVEGLSFDAKLQALQGDSRLSGAFLTGYGGEAKYRAQVEQLVSDASSSVSQAYRSNIGRIGTDEELAEIGRQAVLSLGVNKLNRQAKFETKLAAIDQQMAIRDENENLSAKARQDFQNVLQRAGQSSIGAKGRIALSRLQDQSIGLSLDEAASLIRPVIEDLEDGEKASSVFVGGGGFGLGQGRIVSTPAREATPGELQTAELLRQLITETQKQTEKIDSTQVPSR